MLITNLATHADGARRTPPLHPHLAFGTTCETSAPAIVREWYPATKVVAAVVFDKILYVITESGAVYGKQKAGQPWVISSLPIPQSEAALQDLPRSAKPF